MIDQFTGTMLILLSLLLDMLLAMSRSAFVNSHPAKLKSLEEEGVQRAEVTVRVASESRPLILSLRAAQSAGRLLIVGLALVTYTTTLISTGSLYILGVAGVLLITGLLIGLIEFIGESITLRNPERWALRMTRPVQVLITIFSPIVWLLLKIISMITGRSSDQTHPMVTEEEIMTLVDAGEEEGTIEEEEKAMIYSIFQLADTLVREVMIPRIDIVAFDEASSLIEATEDLLRTGYSRAPVYSGSIDNIVGLVYAKDLLEAWRNGAQDQLINNLLREAYFVPEAKKVDDLLTEMQALRFHLAVVVDEYGGTAGLVTIEDIVEEIVGEIRDEFDFAEEMPYQMLKDGEYLFSGRIDLDDVNQITDANLPKDTSETLGGFIYSQLGKVPVPGEVVKAGGLRLLVEEVSGRRIRKVRAHLMEASGLDVDERQVNNRTSS